LPLGESRATPIRRWQSAQNVCSAWQLEHRGLSVRAASGCIESQSFGWTLRGRTLPSWQSMHSFAVWQLEQNELSSAATVLWRSIQSASCAAP
jgi:hypothetical protein